ncbi:MAG TPA: hypothetical protein VHC00_15100 [Rhizobiaceae bacterium]|nr:hypothetical protein [Rhizobiaceae bacterium]
MRAWFENIAGPQYATGVMWTIAALILLLILLVLARIIRNLTAGTFVAGGRNRRTRLAVMDAAAVDNQRRLVLVRRDDVEHLILIGGPTDVVVEQNIGLPGSAERNHVRAEEPVAAAPPIHAVPPRRERPPAAAEHPRSPQPVEKPEPDVPVPPAPPPKPVSEPFVISNTAPAAPERRVEGPYSPSTSAPQEPPRNAARGEAGVEEEFHPAPPVQPVLPAKPTAAPQTPATDIDRALAKEIETAAVTKPVSETPDRPNTLEDEMSRLLGELSRERG